MIVKKVDYKAFHYSRPRQTLTFIFVKLFFYHIAFFNRTDPGSCSIDRIRKSFTDPTGSG